MEVRRRGAIARGRRHRLRHHGGEDGEEAEGHLQRRRGHRLVSLCTLHTVSQPASIYFVGLNCGCSCWIIGNFGICTNLSTSQMPIIQSQHKLQLFSGQSQAKTLYIVFINSMSRRN